MNMLPCFPSVSLGQIAEIDREGIAPEQIPAGTKYLGLEHIESGGRILDVATVGEGELASTKFRFGPRHLLFGKLRPYLAKIALPDFEGVCSTDILPVLPGDKLDRRYLAHFLRQPSIVDFAASRSTGANLPRLSPKSLAAFAIPLPPLAEQKRIAAILDQADALRRLRRRALDRLDTLGQAIFQKMFGAFLSDMGNWPVVRFGDLVESAKIGVVRAAADLSQDGSIAYLRMDAIQDAGVLHLNALRRTEATERERREYSLRPGDLLFNTRNSRELVGKSAVLRERFDGIYNNNILRVRFSGRASASFVDSFFRTRVGAAALDVRKSGTTSVFAVYQKALMEMPVPLPPIDLQRRYEGVLDRIAEQRATSTRGRTDAEQLFASLQARAFNGNLQP